MFFHDPGSVVSDSTRSEVIGPQAREQPFHHSSE